MGGIVVLVLAFASLAFCLPNLQWKTNGPITGSSCILINEPGVTGNNAWSDNYLCSNNHNLSSWRWSYGLAVPGIENMNCIPFPNPAVPYWEDNTLCIPKSDNEFFYKYNANHVHDSSACVQVTEPSEAGWTDKWFCAYDRAIALQRTFVVPIPPLQFISQYQINNALWWLTKGEWIIGCSFFSPEATNMVCYPGAHELRSRDIIIALAQGAVYSGNIRIETNVGSVTYQFKQRPGTLGCIHGDITTVNSVAVCSCIPGWSGADCNSGLSKLSIFPSIEGSTTFMLNGSSPSTSIARCSISGFPFGNKPTCSVDSFMYRGQIRIAKDSNSNWLYGATGTLSYTIGQTNYTASLTVGYPTMPMPYVCYNGFVKDDGTCLCRAGYTGIDCNTIWCDATCNRGGCVERDGENVCQCNSNCWSNATTPFNQCTECSAIPPPRDACDNCASNTVVIRTPKNGGEVFQSITFVPGSVISEGARCGYDVSIVREVSRDILGGINSERWSLTLKCNRNGVPSVANQFNANTAGRYGLMATITNPALLNFCFQVDITLKTNSASNRFWLCQGHKERLNLGFNNWWFGGPLVINNVYHPTYPFAQVSFRSNSGAITNVNFDDNRQSDFNENVFYAHYGMWVKT